MATSTRFERRGALVELTTQRWVRATGRRVTLGECPWLEGPVGDVDVIGADFFARFADREGLTMVTDGPPRGLVEVFVSLAGPTCDPSRVDGRVAEFYEQTSEYELPLECRKRKSPMTGTQAEARTGETDVGGGDADDH